MSRHSIFSYFVLFSLCLIVVLFHLSAVNNVYALGGEEAEATTTTHNHHHHVKYLTEANYTETLTATATEPWLMVYHAHWCGHCKRLIPALIAALEDPATRGVNIGLVECTENSAICDRVEATAYPTVKFCPRGRNAANHNDDSWVPYTGGRTVPELVIFLHKLSTLQRDTIPRIAEIPSEPLNETEDNKDTSKKILFIFSSPLDDVAFSAIESVLSYDEIEIAVLMDDNNTNTKGPFVALVNDFFSATSPKRHTAPWTMQSIATFISDNRGRSFEHSTPQTFGKILHRSKKSICVMALSSQESSTTPSTVAVAALKQVAMDLKYEEDIIFTYLDGDTWPAFLNVFQIPQNVTYPFVLVYNPREELYYYNTHVNQRLVQSLDVGGSLSSTTVSILHAYLDSIRSGAEAFTTLSTSATISYYLRPWFPFIDTIRAVLGSDALFIAFVVAIPVILTILFATVFACLMYSRKASSSGAAKSSRKATSSTVATTATTTTSKKTSTIATGSNNTKLSVSTSTIAQSTQHVSSDNKSSSNNKNTTTSTTNNNNTSTTKKKENVKKD